MPLIAAVAGALLAARLGFWQLDRAAQKVALQTALESRSRLPALDAVALARTPAAAEPQHYRPAVVSGRWIAERTLFLDNRQMDGKVGFFVVTPLQIEGTSEAVLVERGWVGRNFTDRTALPPIVTPAGNVTVAGRVAPPPSRLFEFAGAASGPIRQNLDIPAYARETSLTLLPLSILQLDTPAASSGAGAGAGADGLARHWPAPAGDVQKHYGYAVQWFAIAVGIAFLYVWHRFIRPSARRR